MLVYHLDHPLLHQAARTCSSAQEKDYYLPVNTRNSSLGYTNFTPNQLTRNRLAFNDFLLLAATVCNKDNPT